MTALGIPQNVIQEYYARSGGDRKGKKKATKDVKDNTKDDKDDEPLIDTGA
jgi:hypothetical protein